MLVYLHYVLLVDNVGLAELCCLDVDDLLLLGPDDPGAVQGRGVLTGKVLLLLGYVRCTCITKNVK